MRILATSDWHLTDIPPGYRKDTYSDELYSKVEFILDFATKNVADIVIAGDVFNVPREGRKFLNKYIKLFTEYSTVNIYCCAGQHDQINHSPDLSDTNLGLLIASRLVNRGDCGDIVTKDWGCLDIQDECVVLAHHVCVTEQPNSIIAGSTVFSELAKITKAKIVITGDYHRQHVYRSDGRLFINPGTIARHNIDEQDYEPSFFIVDTETLYYDRIVIPTLPKEQVFDMQSAFADKRAGERKIINNAFLEKYITEVSQLSLRMEDFVSILTKTIRDCNVTVEVIEEINSIVGE